MLELNTLLLSIGNSIGLNLLSFPPISSVTTNKGRINHWDIRTIQKALEQNFIPVTFGDVVFDDHQQFSILSGDQIVPYLASRLQVRKILMLTDVDGVYSKNPKLDSTAHLLNEIDVNDQELMSQIFTTEDNSSGKIRVTGEMGKKLDELVPILEKGIETYILSGLETKYLRSHLERKKSFLGTKLMTK
jgi:isopentenyl phosphate kinase